MYNFYHPEELTIGVGGAVNGVVGVDNGVVGADNGVGGADNWVLGCTIVSIRRS